MTLDLSAIPIVDHHCHSLLKAGAPLDAEAFRAIFTESVEPEIVRRHVPQTMFYRRAVRELAALLDCEPVEEAVLARRAAFTAEEYTRRLMRDAGIEAMLVDYGFRSADYHDHEELAALVPCRVERVLRLETVAQELILQHDSFDAMVEAFRAVAAQARQAGYVSLKSIIAYRTGLAIQPVTSAEAREAYEPVRAQAQREGRIRLASKPLLDYLIMAALDENRVQRLPFQFHSGFGDADVDLLTANPLCLRGLLQSGRYAGFPIVILHMGYPYARESGYLASLYRQVYVDLSLAVPFAAGGIPTLIGQLLELAPTSKLMYASDAFSLPELYWLGARWGRWGLGVVLEDLMQGGFLTEGEAMRVAEQILGGNAREVYRL
ncbi:MAG: amidohydrolase family protein [Chloroflexi bacterium]|nr:amidohydrolase family protein [Chloroflexota bacterium]